MDSMNITSSVVAQNLTNSEWKWSFRSILVLTICGLITVLTILGNGLVLISIKFRLHARSYSDYFIVSLCLADFFVGLFVMPLMTIHSIHLRWPFHYRLCYIWMSIDFTCSTASFLTLASMALDRYYALTTPYFHLRNRSYSSVFICIIGSWIIPFAIWPSSIFLAHHFSFHEPACVHPAHPFIIVVLCTFFYYIPLLFMLACYSKIIVNIKNIEVMIKEASGSFKFNLADNEYKTRSAKISNNKNNHSKTSSLRSLILRYFQRNTLKHRFKRTPLPGNESPFVAKNISANRHTRRATIGNQVMIPNTLLPSSISNHRLNRQTTTATFTGQKRCLNDAIEGNRSKIDLSNNQEEEQFVRTRFNSGTSSLPAARCIAYYYHQNQTPSRTTTITTAIIEDPNNHSRTNSSAHERSRSQSHSSSQGTVNGGLITADTSERNSSFENTPDDEHHRLNRRNHPSCLSTPYNSSRYSQRAVAQFMHERNKARLRRNQKASRMLGILLAVFLICWVPFIISYPTMIFYPSKFSAQVESIIFWFGYVNSLLNPFLYVYSSRNFRQAIIETLCCFTRLKSRQHLRYQWSLQN